MIRHKTTNINGIKIDNEIVPLITALWGIGIQTSQCCQGDLDEYAHIQFTTMKDAFLFIEKFRRVIDDFVVHDDRCYNLGQSYDDSNTSIMFLRRNFPDILKFVEFNLDYDAFEDWQIETWESENELD